MFLIQMYFTVWTSKKKKGENKLGSLRLEQTHQSVTRHLPHGVISPTYFIDSVFPCFHFDILINVHVQ